MYIWYKKIRGFVIEISMRWISSIAPSIYSRFYSVFWRFLKKNLSSKMFVAWSVAKVDLIGSRVTLKQISILTKISPQQRAYLSTVFTSAFASTGAPLSPEPSNTGHWSKYKLLFYKYMTKKKHPINRHFDSEISPKLAYGLPASSYYQITALNADAK